MLQAGGGGPGRPTEGPLSQDLVLSDPHKRPDQWRMAVGAGPVGEGRGNGEETLTRQLGSNQLNFINTASVYILSSFLPFILKGFCFRTLPVLMKMMMMVWSQFLAHLCQTSLFQT